MIEGPSWRDVKAPDSLRDRVLQGRPASRRSGLGSAGVWRTAVIAGCLSLVGLAALLPQRSAASSLDHLVASQKDSGVMFHLVSYWIDERGRTPKIWSGYVKGNRWHYVQSDFEQAFDGANTTTFHRGEDYATTEPGQEHGSGQFLGSADLSVWKVADRKNLALDHETLWRGRKVDKYTMRFHFRDSRGADHEGLSTLYADPVRNLPLYEEDLYSPTSGNALEWQYIEPANEDLLRIKLPAGTEVREATIRGNPAPLGLPAKVRDKLGR